MVIKAPVIQNLDMYNNDDDDDDDTSQIHIFKIFIFFLYI